MAPFRCLLPADAAARSRSTKATRMESRYRVSVIIPVYNRQALCERALRSALAQRVDGLEIVIVDDGSKEPFRLPADLGGRSDVRLLRQPVNGGESAARNAGIAAARGDWIAFLDSDDYWLPGTLGPRLARAEEAYRVGRDPLVTYVAGFVTHNQRTGRIRARIPRPGSQVAMFASGCWFCPGSTSLLRREVYDRVGPCDTALRRLQDLDWYLRLALAGGRVEVWEGLVAVVETGPKPSAATLETAVDHLRLKYARSESALALAPAHMRRLEAYFDVERASIFAAEGNWPRALRHLWSSFRRVPRLSLQLERFWREETLTEAEMRARTPDRQLHHAERQGTS
jgi:glycosyltransferase involved in cell wall biosynthesis